MPADAAETRSHLRMLAAVLAVVVSVAAVAAVSGLLMGWRPEGGAGRPEQTPGDPSPIGETPVGGPAAPDEEGAAARPVAGMRSDLEAYLGSYGSVTKVEILPIGPDGLPVGSRFRARIAEGTPFLAASGEQAPPVYAEAVVTRADGSRFAIFLVCRPDTSGNLAWSDLLTGAIR